MEIAEPISVRCSELVVRGDSVLLCHRDKDQQWFLPGGAPHRSEGAADCARREVLEETGLATAPDGVAFAFDVTDETHSVHLIELVFWATESDPTIDPDNKEEGLQPSFVPLESLDLISLQPSIAELIRSMAQDSSPRTAIYLGNLWQSVD